MITMLGRVGAATAGTAAISRPAATRFRVDAAMAPPLEPVKSTSRIRLLNRTRPPRGGKRGRMSPRNGATRVLLGAIALLLGGAGHAAEVAPARPDVARTLPLTAVRLTGGPLKHAQDLDAEYLLHLQPDRMLAFYRQRAGLAPKAEPYDGWDGDGHHITGHIAGHYLSAVSLMWAATGDRRFKERADYVVGELKAVQDKNGDGALSVYAAGRDTFATL